MRWEGRHLSGTLMLVTVAPKVEMVVDMPASFDSVTSCTAVPSGIVPCSVVCTIAALRAPISAIRNVNKQTHRSSDHPGRTAPPSALGDDVANYDWLRARVDSTAAASFYRIDEAMCSCSHASGSQDR